MRHVWGSVEGMEDATGFCEKATASAEGALSRRRFCVCACRVGAGVALGGLAGCGSSTAPTVPDFASLATTVTGRIVSVAIAEGSPVATVGSVAFLDTVLGEFLLARTGTDSFTVLTAKCTHQACTITRFSADQFVCPCHGSRFTTSGAVARGPASRSLETFASTFDGTVLTFAA